MTTDQIAANVVALHEQGLTISDIVVRVGVSRWTIHRILRRSEEPLPSQVSRVDVDQLRVFWAEGMKTADIAAHFGVHIKTIERLRRTLNLPPRAKGGRPKEVLTKPVSAPPPPPQPVGLIGDLIASGGKWRNLSAIAAKHGMTLAKVQQEYHRARSAR